MAVLCLARLVVATLPFHRWRETLGRSVEDRNVDVASARRFASHVEWAARLLPFTTKCLPRAMALSWILRIAKIGHCVIFAVRPPKQRGTDDQLHARVEVAGETILGDLPGPWIETLRLGHSGHSIKPHSP